MYANFSIILPSIFVNCVHNDGFEVLFLKTCGIFATATLSLTVADKKVKSSTRSREQMTTSAGPHL